MLVKASKSWILKPMLIILTLKFKQMSILKSEIASIYRCQKIFIYLVLSSNNFQLFFQKNYKIFKNIFWEVFWK